MSSAAASSKSPATTGTAKPARRSIAQELGLVVVVVLLGLILALYGWRDAAPGRPNTFLNFDNLIDGIATPMSYYAIMAVGATALQNLPADASAAVVLPIGILVPMAIGLVCGLINGGLVVSLNLHPFIVTLGTMSIFRGLANVLPEQKTLPAAGKQLPTAFTSDFMRVEMFGLQPMPLIIMLICVALGWFYLRMMVAGRETYVIGGNAEGA